MICKGGSHEFFYSLAAGLMQMLRCVDRVKSSEATVLVPLDKFVCQLSGCP